MKKSELRQLIKEEISKVLNEKNLDPLNQKLKDKYIQAYVLLSIDAYAFDNSNDWVDVTTFGDIEAHAKEYGYENTLRIIDKMEDVRAMRRKFSQASNQEDPLKAKTPGTWVDNLSMRDPLMYLTKKGKMNKLDVDRLKSRINKNLGL
jgi:hypothetical protein